MTVNLADEANVMFDTHIGDIIKKRRFDVDLIRTPDHKRTAQFDQVRYLGCVSRITPEPKHNALIAAPAINGHFQQAVGQHRLRQKPFRGFRKQSVH
jgi:hypothetical protein